MIVPSELSSMLSVRPIVLWVEDELTKEYLLRVWSPDDSLFQIIVGGSISSVVAVVKDLRTSKGNGHVFGLTDRDFRPSNKTGWNSPDVFIFRPTVFEIENFLLLSWEALAGCDQNQERLKRTEMEIKQRAESEAKRMTWWMSCRTVISGIYGRVMEGFPEHPAIANIQNQEQAESHIFSNDWYCNFPNNSSHIQNRNFIVKDLLEANTNHQEQFSKGAWVSEYSGKEIFRHLRGYLFNQAYDSPDSMDVDLAKSVGEWQNKNGKVPTELIELKDTIKSKVGI